MPLKSISVLLLVLLICFILGGVCDTAHAAQSGVTSVSCEQNVSHSGAECNFPGVPSGDEDGHANCDFCCGCACHLSVSLGSFSFNYLPLLSDIQGFERFTFLPEVFLSKFVPPQLRA